jgi:DNA-binding LytR/AlgR family response regulator
MRIDNRVIKPEQVQYCQGAGNYTLIYLQDGKYLMSSHTLKFVATMLHMVRACKSYAINKKYVSKLVDGRLHFNTGKSIPIPPRKQKEFEKLLK